MKLETKTVKEYVEKKLSIKRLTHSKRVAEYAQKLAAIHKIDPEKAFLAGMLHDIARELDQKVLIEKAKTYGLTLDMAERYQPELLHGPIGAIIAKEELGISDEEILSAIAKHTLGDADMSPLDEVIFLADMLEEGREFPGVENLRALAFLSLDKAMLEALKESLIYVIQKNVLVHPRTVEAFNSFVLKLR